MERAYLPPARSWQPLVELALEEVRGQFKATTYEAFELYGRRGVPLDEVAKRLSMSPEAVRQARHRWAVSLAASRLCRNGADDGCRIARCSQRHRLKLRPACDTGDGFTRSCLSSPKKASATAL